MTASLGILMGVGRTIITIIGFFIAYKVASYKREDSELEKDNPIKQFWKDYPGHKDEE